MRRNRNSIRYSLILCVCLLTTSCARQSQQRLIEAVPVHQAPAVAALVSLPKLNSAKLSDVQEAVKRVFHDSVEIDSSVNPSYVTGDFNGDDSQDIAVVLKPSTGKIATLNEEPAWLLRDPLATTQSKSQLQVSERETLLAVIHGYGAEDWRDPQATQTFLLKNVVASGMTTQTAKSVSESNAGRRLPRFAGDLIVEVLHGSAGYIYFSHATYAWYDPKTYRGDAERGAFHGRSMGN